jgi:hypothetical protein
MTPTQRDIVAQLTAEYGEPDKVVTNTSAAFIRAGVIVRVAWWKQQRELFILPNGDRLNWEIPQ